VFRPRHVHLAALLLIACGQVEGGSDSTADGDTGGVSSTADGDTGGAVSTADGDTGGVDSAGGSATSGTGGDVGTGGGGATGGDHATGGAVSAGGSDQSGTGGASDLLEPWGPCNYEHPGLDPPCGESDVNGLLSGCGLWFDVPLAEVVPPALDLQVVLLPLAGSDLTQPLVLRVIFVATENLSQASGEETFDLVEPAGYVRAGDVNEDDLPGYVAEAEGYGVAQVALQRGTEILSVHRGLYLGTTDSVRPGDLCVK